MNRNRLRFELYDKKYTLFTLTQYELPAQKHPNMQKQIYKETK